MELPELDYVPTMPSVIRRAAERFGDRDFIVMPDRRMTFNEAEAASRRVGRQLLAAGVTKGTRVGAILPQGTDWVVAWLAATRIGALFMPLSTAYKPVEVRRALRLGDIEHLIMSAELHGEDNAVFMEGVVPGLGATFGQLRSPLAPYLRTVWVNAERAPAWANTLQLDFRATGVGPMVDEELLVAVEAEVVPADLLLAVFTSGTSDVPKAPTHTHGNFFRHGANLARFEQVTKDRRTFCAMPFFWIGGVGMVLNMALAIGHAVLCTERFDPEEAVDLMESEGVTKVSIWGQKLRSYLRTSGRDVSGIPALAAIASATIADRELSHGSMGMTETVGPYTSPGSEATRALPEELRGSFGQFVTDVEYRIADPLTGVTLAGGEEGEVCVRGYSLMSGLYKKERHETFDDDGWYHTGDRGEVADDCLFFRGRLSEMIKTSGANVAPREVELVLEASREVALAVVVGIPDPERGEIVAAALFPEVGETIDIDVICERARAELSTYKVPRRLLVLDLVELPQLPSGKPDRMLIRGLLSSLADGTAAGQHVVSSLASERES